MTIADHLQAHPLLRVAVALVLGIVVGDTLAYGVEAWVWLAVAAALLLLVLVAGRRMPCAQSALVLIVASFVGAALASRAIRQTDFPFSEDEPVHYEAVVADEPKVRGKILQCDLLLTSVGGKPLGRPFSVKAAILRDTTTGDWRRLRVGSGIEAWSVMQPLENYQKGGNFDYVRWLRVRGFRAQTFVFYADWIARSVSMRSLPRLDRMRIKALRMRRKLVDKIAGQVGAMSAEQGDSQQQAVIAAMVLGDKHALSRETRDAYSVSGASHVLALSGLHLGIIYAMLTLLFGRWRRVWLSQALVQVAVWAYVLLVGMGASVMRAAVMLTIYSLCLVARRDKAQINTLAFAAMCLLVVNPLCLWDVGFQMSFMAVLAIVIYYRPLYHLLPMRHKLAKWAWGMAVVSLTAQIGTAPLVAYYFGRFSCYFLVTNFIVVPTATAIIYGAVALLLSPFPWLDSFLAHCLAVVAGWLNGALGWMAGLPGACIDNIHINTLQLFLVYVVIAGVTVAVAYIGKVNSMEKLDAAK